MPKNDRQMILKVLQIPILANERAFIKWNGTKFEKLRKKYFETFFFNFCKKSLKLIFVEKFETKESYVKVS